MEFVGLTEAHIEKLKQVYKGVNVEAELMKMSVWLAGPKGEKRVGTIAFILNWLSNAMPIESRPPNSEQLAFLEDGSPLRPFMLEYLEDLWKGREHLLQFNTIKRKS